MDYALAVFRAVMAPVLDRLDRLERLIMVRADDLVARLNVATDELAADLSDIRQALRDALADADAATAAAVTEVLDRFEAPISTLEALGADEADPVPAPVDEEQPTP